MATIQQLAERKAKLEAELSEVRAEIAALAGQSDPEPKVQRAVKATKTRKAVRET